MRIKIRKGDTVEVISGRLEDKGKRGEVINVLTGERRVVVQGVNVRTKHQRQMQTQSGQQIEQCSFPTPRWSQNRPGFAAFDSPVKRLKYGLSSGISVGQRI